MCTAEGWRGFVIFKTPMTRSLCFLASFTFYGEYEGYHSNHIGKNINPSMYVRKYFWFETPLQLCESFSKNQIASGSECF